MLLFSFCCQKTVPSQRIQNMCTNPPSLSGSDNLHQKNSPALSFETALHSRCTPVQSVLLSYISCTFIQMQGIVWLTKWELATAVFTPRRSCPVLSV